MPEPGIGGEPTSRFAAGSWRRYLLYCVTWLSLFLVTLGLSANLVSTRLAEHASAEDYGVYTSVVGFLVIMPVGLLLASVAFWTWKRWWLPLLLAIVLAAATAFAPVILN